MVLFFASDARAEKLQKVKITFKTTDEDKDHDTKLDVKIFLGDEQTADGKDLGQPSNLVSICRAAIKPTSLGSSGTAR